MGDNRPVPHDTELPVEVGSTVPGRPRCLGDRKFPRKLAAMLRELCINNDLNDTDGRENVDIGIAHTKVCEHISTFLTHGLHRFADIPPQMPIPQECKE